MLKTCIACCVLLAAGSSLASAAEHAATIDAAQTRQTIEGFGTCLVSWGKRSRDPNYLNDELARIYVQDMGMNFLRVNVAPWGLPRIENADDIGADDIDLNAKGNSRVPVFIEFAKKLKKLNPDLRIIGTVWSPPPWMKVNGQITGGKGDKKEPSIHGDKYDKKKGRESKNRMQTKYYQHFCNSIVAMCELHKKEGVPFYAMSPGNEVMFSQDFESCVWTAKDFATIIAMLGKTLEEKGFGEVLLYGPETMTQHNWSIANPLYIKELRKNTEAWEQLDCFATHGYVDGFATDTTAESSLAYWDLIKDHGKRYWMTEGGTGDHDWPKPLTGVAAAIHNSLVYGNANAFVPWQVQSGEPNGHALMPDSGMTKKTQAFRHFSRFIPADAIRLQVSEEAAPLRVSAFRHEDSKTLSIIVINPSQETQSLALSLKGLDVDGLVQYRTSASEDLAQLAAVPVTNGALSVELPAESMITLSTIDLAAGQ